MIAFLGIDGNLPFLVALGVMLAIALVEGVGLLFGIAVSSLVDELLPDMDIDADVDLDIDADADLDFDVDMDADVDADLDVTAPDSPDLDGSGALEGGAGAFTRVLGWLTVGRVPVLILLVAFLTVFGLAGLILQGALHTVIGFALPGSLASIAVLFVAVPATRYFGLGFSKIVPKAETSAVSSDTFIGKVAVVFRGEAKAGQPAEAKLTDRHGQTHYILVSPDKSDEEFGTGDEVLLVRKLGSQFTAIRNPNAALSRR